MLTTSFGYLCTICAVSASCIVLIVPFAINVATRLNKIRYGMASTISSFSADPNADPISMRFLISMTSAIGWLFFTLMCMETATRDEFYWPTLTQLGVSALFPLVGLFHSQGSDMELVFYCVYRLWDNLVLAIPEGISDFIHCSVAMIFMVTGCVCNFVKMASMDSPCMANIVFCILNIVFMFSLICSQGVWYTYHWFVSPANKVTWKQSCLPRLSRIDLEACKDVEHCQYCACEQKPREICVECSSLINQPKGRDMPTVLMLAAFSSFLSEALLFICVIISTIVCSVDFSGITVLDVENSE